MSSHDYFLPNLINSIQQKIFPHLHITQKNFKTTIISQKFNFFSKIDIESWIIPLYYMDIVKSLCWLHPDWTKHSFKSESHFKVGKVTDGNEIKLVQNHS